MPKTALQSSSPIEGRRRSAKAPYRAPRPLGALAKYSRLPERSHRSPRPLGVCATCLCVKARVKARVKACVKVAGGCVGRGVSRREARGAVGAGGGASRHSRAPLVGAWPSLDVHGSRPNAAVA